MSMNNSENPGRNIFAELEALRGRWRRKYGPIDQSEPPGAPESELAGRSADRFDYYALGAEDGTVRPIGSGPFKFGGQYGQASAHTPSAKRWRNAEGQWVSEVSAATVPEGWFRSRGNEAMCMAMDPASWGADEDEAAGLVDVHGQPLQNLKHVRDLLRRSKEQK